MPPFTLKVKGNKSFVPFFAMATADELQKTWRVCTRVKDSLENGSRLENLSWRLWFLHNKHKKFTAKKSKKLATVLEAKLESLPEKLADFKKRQSVVKQQLPEIKLPKIEGDQTHPIPQQAPPVPTQTVPQIPPNAANKNPNLSIQFQSDGAITLSGQIEDLFGDFGSMFADFDIEAPSEGQNGWDLGGFEHMDPKGHPKEGHHHGSANPASSSSSSALTGHAVAAASVHPSAPMTPQNHNYNLNNPDTPQNSISLALLEAAGSCEPLSSNSANTAHRFNINSLNAPRPHDGSPLLWGDPSLSSDRSQRVPTSPQSLPPLPLQSAASNKPQIPQQLQRIPFPALPANLINNPTSNSSADSSNKKLKMEAISPTASPATSPPSSSSSNSSLNSMTSFQKIDSEEYRYGMSCFNCGASETPLWRRSIDGKMLCNACGLYLKSHNQARPKASPLRKDGKASDDLQCSNCFTSTTPLWRRNDQGDVLCNACGLYLKLHHDNRPISMKSDTIKKRHRSTEGTGQPSGKKKKAPQLDSGSTSSDNDTSSSGAASILMQHGHTATAPTPNHTSFVPNTQLPTTNNNHHNSSASSSSSSLASSSTSLNAPSPFHTPNLNHPNHHPNHLGHNPPNYGAHLSANNAHQNQNVHSNNHNANNTQIAHNNHVNNNIPRNPTPHNIQHSSHLATHPHLKHSAVNESGQSSGNF